jgi:hypothetical protein
MFRPVLRFILKPRAFYGRICIEQSRVFTRRLLCFVSIETNIRGTGFDFKESAEINYYYDSEKNTR